MLRHYYLGKLLGWSFWSRLLSGEVALGPALRDFLKTALKRLKGTASGGGAAAATTGPSAAASLPERMAEGLERFGGPALVILSGKDLTAREFEDAAKVSQRWAKLLRQNSVTIERLAEADHTFSQAAMRERAEKITGSWLDGGSAPASKSQSHLLHGASDPRR